ncbi:DUF2924 domain-containing protein [Azospirillaceae bacterium]
MTNNVLAQIAALSAMLMPDLKARWRELFETEPPPFNRSFLVSRLTYRIQELAYGGLSMATIARLDAIASDEKYVDREAARKKIPTRPIPGTQIVREWQGVEHIVTVQQKHFEYQGHSYKSLSAVARAITGTRWSGPAFFGLRIQGEAQ